MRPLGCSGDGAAAWASARTPRSGSTLATTPTPSTSWSFRLACRRSGPRTRTAGSGTVPRRSLSKPARVRPADARPPWPRCRTAGSAATTRWAAPRRSAAVGHPPGAGAGCAGEHEHRDLEADRGLGRAAAAGSSRRSAGPPLVRVAAGECVDPLRSRRGEGPAGGRDLARRMASRWSGGSWASRKRWWCVRRGGDLKYDFHLSDAERATRWRSRAGGRGGAPDEECRSGRERGGAGDDQEGNWVGWHDQMTLSLLAAWFLVGEAKRGKAGVTLTGPRARMGLASPSRRRAGG